MFIRVSDSLARSIANLFEFFRNSSRSRASFEARLVRFVR